MTRDAGAACRCATSSARPGSATPISRSSRRARSSGPTSALLWDLAALYDIEFEELARLAGHITDGGRARIAVALRALGELTDDEQEEALRYIAELGRRRRE